MVESNAERIDLPLTYDAAYASMQAEMEKVLLATPAVVRTYTAHLLGAKGKHIRAKALLCCAMDANNRIEPNAVLFAAATEILHLATLVHDDVIDNAAVRRGIPSLQNKYGKRTAVILGDYLFSVALRLASSVTNRQKYEKHRLPDYVSQIAIGELGQHIHNGDYDLSEMEYYKIISGKTAALFEASFYGGALLSGCQEDQAKRYKRLGWHAGMIFQLIDDCSDYESTQKIAKKTVRSDYEQGVVTLPLIHAMGRSFAFKKEAATGSMVAGQINRAVTELGGLFYTRQIASKFHQRALEILSKIEASQEKREMLTLLLKKAMQSPGGGA